MKAKFAGLGPMRQIVRRGSGLRLRLWSLCTCVSTDVRICWARPHEAKLSGRLFSHRVWFLCQRMVFMEVVGRNDIFSLRASLRFYLGGFRVPAGRDKCRSRTHDKFWGFFGCACRVFFVCFGFGCSPSFPFPGSGFLGRDLLGCDFIFKSRAAHTRTSPRVQATRCRMLA